MESTAILAEVLPVHDTDTESHAHSRTAIRALLESPTTNLVDLNVLVARKAGDLRTSLGLKTWDAVHLSTAVLAGVDVLIVRDGKFPTGDYEGVHVTGPYDIDEGKLFPG